jgi:hypothetical protein
MSPKDFGFEPGTLPAIVGHLNAASSTLDTGIGGGPEVIDAGATSGMVGGTLKEITLATAAIGEAIDDISGKVDAADGSYADIENSNEGMLKLQKLPPPSTGNHGPLMDSPDRY